jgi:hypothetical protein
MADMDISVLLPLSVDELLAGTYLPLGQALQTGKWLRAMLNSHDGLPYNDTAMGVHDIPLGLCHRLHLLHASSALQLMRRNEHIHKALDKTKCLETGPGRGVNILPCDAGAQRDTSNREIVGHREESINPCSHESCSPSTHDAFG